VSDCPFNSCDGSGFIVDEETGIASDCQCRPQRINRVRSRSLSGTIPRRYRGVSFDRPPVTAIDRNVVNVVERFTQNINNAIEEGNGLWFMGPNGTGKTTLAMLVAKEALKRNRTVGIYSLPRLLAEIRETFERDTQRSYTDLISRLSSVELLQIDDVGAEKTSEWVLEQLYAIINTRYEEQRSIVITTNLDQEQLESQITARTVSRLIEMCGDPIVVDGPDRRIELSGFQTPSDEQSSDATAPLPGFE